MLSTSLLMKAWRSLGGAHAEMRAMHTARLPSTYIMMGGQKGSG
jgi:hypothetical protein